MVLILPRIPVFSATSLASITKNLMFFQSIVAELGSGNLSQTSSLE